MTIPAHLELSTPSERRRSRLARLYLEHERLAIAGGTLLTLLLVWEALGTSGLVDPLFISSPTRVARAAWLLSHDRDFWTDVEVSATEFVLGYGAALAVAIPLGLRRDYETKDQTERYCSQFIGFLGRKNSIFGFKF